MSANTLHDISFTVAAEVKQTIQLQDGIAGEELVRELEAGNIRTSLPVINGQAVEAASLEVRRYHSDGSEEVIGIATETRFVEPEVSGYNLDDGITEEDGEGPDADADE